MKNKNKKITYLWIFEYNEFTWPNFKKEIERDLPLYSTYTLLIKFSFNNRTEFRMCGSQVGFYIDENYESPLLEELYNVILERISQSLDSYKMNSKSDLDFIELLVILHETLPRLKTKSYSKIIKEKQIEMPKKLASKLNFSRNFNNNLLPLTLDERYYGVPLTIEQKKDILPNIHSLFKKTKEIKKSILNSLIKENIIVSWEELINLNNSFFILNKKNLIITIKNKVNNISLKLVFTSKGEIFKNLIIDNIINNTTFNRKIDNYTLTITHKPNTEENIILNYSVDNKLEKIVSTIPDKNQPLNNKIGTFSIETITNPEGWEKVTSIGYHLNPEIKWESKNYINIFKIEEFRENEEMIIHCVNKMLSHNKAIFYSHNFGKTDLLFILKTLSNFNQNHEMTYELNPIVRNDHVIYLKIQKTNDLGKKNSIKLIDTNNYFSLKFDELALAFNINHIKINTLKEKLIILLKIMTEFNKIIFSKYKLNLTNSITISKLSLDIFLKKYYKNKVIPSINQLSMYNFISQAYFGGITEVYKPYGENLIYLDVNSLYPYAALNSMPGLNSTFIEDLSGNGLELENLFGFFYAEVETNNSYLGLLPLKNESGNFYPNGKFTGIWSSIELNYAKSKGYSIKVLYGYQWDKNENVFDSYINELFEEKQKSSYGYKTIIKSLLNNLIGRFGLKIEKPISKIVNYAEKLNILKTREVYSEKEITEEYSLITFNPKISIDIVNQHGLNYQSVIKNEKLLDVQKIITNNKEKNFKDISIATAAMVTSYARVFMHKAKNSILQKGGEIYYSDTDSLVIGNLKIEDIPLKIGKNIGEFKIEHIIDRGYFLSNKLYGIEIKNKSTESNKHLIIAKGVNANTLSINDLKNLYYIQKNIITKRDEIVKNYNKGSIAFLERKVNLSLNSYTKREKIWEKGKWIDTKPININPKK